MKSSLVQIIFSITFIITSVFASGGEVKLDFKKFMVIGFEYGVDGVPCPFRGVWKQYYYKPDESHMEREMTWKWIVSDAKEISVEVIIRHQSESVKLSFSKNLDDWSNGLYDQVKREQILSEKTLLHFDKEVMNASTGKLPADVEIEKHVLGRRGKEDVCLVIYRSANLDALKKSFRMTEWQSWSLTDHDWFTANN